MLYIDRYFISQTIQTAPIQLKMKIQVVTDLIVIKYKSSNTLKHRL